MHEQEISAVSSQVDNDFYPQWIKATLDSPESPYQKLLAAQIAHRRS